MVGMGRRGGQRSRTTDKPALAAVHPAAPRDVDIARARRRRSRSAICASRATRLHAELRSDAGGRRRRRARLDRRARPGRPRARQEPARSRAPPARRARAAPGLSWSAPATRSRSRPCCAAALAADAVVIPFGGGSNISGSLEAPAGRDAHRRLGRHGPAGPRALDRRRRRGSPRCRPACSGRELEEQLNARGWTLGHFPDSFTHSTLGGWIATRSSGMQSDKYGDIADLTRGLRVVDAVGHARRRGRCRAPRPGRACAR